MGCHIRHPVSDIDFTACVIFKHAARFFTNETYTTIENEQHVLTEYRLPGSIERRYYSEEATAPTTVRSVQHVLLPENEEASSDKDLSILSSSFIHKVYKLADKQEAKRNVTAPTSMERKCFCH